MRKRSKKNLFQYQKGAIKTPIDTFSRHSSAKFQYQKGAIKTHHHADAERSALEFQYQKGAIKTREASGRSGAAPGISIPKRCD